MEETGVHTPSESSNIIRYVDPMVRALPEGCISKKVAHVWPFHELTTEKQFAR